MYFKPVDIRGLTFRRGLFGFRKGDVKDFVRHVLEDYDLFLEKESQLTDCQQELAQKQELLLQQNEKVAQLTIRIGQLTSDLTSLRELEGEYQDLEKMKLMAQHTANTVQEEADKLLAKAKQENERNMRQTEAQKMNQLMNIQIEVDGLVKKQQRLTAQITEKKSELIDLEIQCEETLAQKQGLMEETQLLKENYQSLRESLMQNAREQGENLSDEQTKTFLDIKAKRIG